MKYASLERTHRLLFNTVVTVGVIALAAAEGNLFYFVLILLGVCIGYIRAEKPLIPARTNNLLLPFILLFTILDYLFISESFLLSAVHLLLLIQAVKLVSENTEREYKLFYFVSLVNLCVAAVLTQELIFGAIFVIYMVTITAALIVFNLLMQAKKSNIPTTPSLPPSFFFGICSMSTVTLGLTVLLFLFVPRVGFRLFRTALNPESITGISDTVDLTESTDIFEDETQVAQIKFYGYNEPTDYLVYLRCAVLIHYEEGKWWRASPELLFSDATEEDMIQFHEKRLICHRQIENQRFVFHPPQETVSFSPNWRARLGVQMFLNPTTDPFFPVIGEPLRIEFFSRESPSQLLVSRMGTFYYPTLRRETCGCDILTTVIRKDAPLETCFNHHRIGGFDYTQLEPDSRYFPRERIRELTERIVRDANARTPYEAACTVSNYLRANYTYTTSPRRYNTKIDPVCEFLFETKKGHCEYFASALAVMLRSIGIGARVVNGYRGGEWNSYGKFYTIRRKNAHCWVEIYLDNDPNPNNGSLVGWTTLDPTPPYTQPKKGAFSFLSDFISHLKIRWLNYVIFYDASKWHETVSGIARQGTNAIYEASEWWRSFTNFFKRISSGIGFPIIAFIIISLGILLILRHTYKKTISQEDKTKLKPKPSSPAILFYKKMLALAERRGLIRLPSMTPYELIHPLTRVWGINHRDNILFVTEMFVKVRYGGIKLNADEQTRLGETLDSLSRLTGRKGSA